MKYLDFWRCTNKYLILTNDFRHLQPIGCLHSANELIGFSPYSPLHQSHAVTLTDVLTRVSDRSGTCAHGLQDEWASAALLRLLRALHVAAPNRFSSACCRLRFVIPAVTRCSSPRLCLPSCTVFLSVQTASCSLFVPVCLHVTDWKEQYWLVRATAPSRSAQTQVAMDRLAPLSSGTPAFALDLS